MRRSPVAASTMRAARPDTPSRSRSDGSSSASMVSSGIASTRPAPKSGIGLRRHDGLAAVGGNREQVKERFAGGVERLEPAVRGAASRADFRDRPGAADGGHVVAGGAARGVERGPEPFLRRFDFEKVVETEPELLELGGR